MTPEKLPLPDPPPSLADRLGAAARRAPGGPRDGRMTGWALALLLPLGPILTTLGADRLAETVAATPAGSEAGEASRVERRALAQLGSGGFAPTLDRVARLLPPEARLVWLSVDRGEGEGALTAEVSTPDPDLLRAALARDGAGRRLRVVGERRGDGVMIVSIEGAP